MSRKRETLSRGIRPRSILIALEKFDVLNDPDEAKILAEVLRWNVLNMLVAAEYDIAVPKELIDFRHAMAHGLVAKIGKSEVNELVKFKKQDDDSLEVEFSITLEPERLERIRKLLRKIRVDISKKVSE